MKGYFKLPEATEKAFAGGWFHSGDWGKMDADGSFTSWTRQGHDHPRRENIYPARD